MKDSPKKEQSTESCNICRGMHATATCNQLVKLKPDDKAVLIRKHDLCFMCLKKGHISKFCKNVPECGKCGKPHNTIFHGRTMPQKKGLNVDAAAFVQEHAPGTVQRSQSPPQNNDLMELEDVIPAPNAASTPNPQRDIVQNVL